MRLKLILSMFLLGLTCVTITPAMAQGEGEFWKPEQVIQFDLILDGPDADKATHAELRFSAKSVLPDQDGLQPVFNAQGHRKKPGAFTFSVTVPDNVASGDYTVNVTAGPSTDIYKQIRLPEAIANHVYPVRNILHFSVGVKDLQLVSATH